MAKVEWLKFKFHEHFAIPISWLNRISLSDNRSVFGMLANKKEKLIINGHGNPDQFMELSPFDLYDRLMAAGLNHDRFDAIYLLGCSVGGQFYSRSNVSNYMKLFAGAVKRGPAKKLKVYAPRAKIIYFFDEEYRHGHMVETVLDARIQVTDDDDNVLEDYSFETGMMQYII